MKPANVFAIINIYTVKDFAIVGTKSKAVAGCLRVCDYLRWISIIQPNWWKPM